MISVKRKGFSDKDILQKYTTSWPQHRVRRARKAMWLLFENHPILRMLDQIIHSKGTRSARPPGYQRPRKFSVYMEELPTTWKTAFEQMDAGFLGEAGALPVPSMIATTKSKMCEFSMAAQIAGAPNDLCVVSAIAYERSLLGRVKPLSKKTVLSAIRQVRDFARYIGVDGEVLEHFADRIRFHENRSHGALPQKEASILALPEYSDIFALALDMLGAAEKTKKPRVAQSLRNKAVAITLFCPFPLRVADTRLRFGKEVVWDGEHYRFNLRISKTGRSFTAYILPVFGFFIDQLILQGSSTAHLNDLRSKCIQNERLLFVNYNDTPPHERYVSYLWAETFGIGSHAARTHLHNSFGRLGARGVELAMRACDHRSEKTAEAYRTSAFALLSLEKIHDDLAADFTDKEWQHFFGSSNTLVDDLATKGSDHA
jgi:hypothetical protein